MARLRHEANAHLGEVDLGRAGVDGEADGRQSRWHMPGARGAGASGLGGAASGESAREERNCSKPGVHGRNWRGLPSPEYGRRAACREGERIYNQWQFRD